MQHSLHSVWDDNLFALVPKGDVWTVHVLATPSYSMLEFAGAWHNISLRKGALVGQSEISICKVCTGCVYAAETVHSIFRCGQILGKATGSDW
jgi:hypothetical protein